MGKSVGNSCNFPGCQGAISQSLTTGWKGISCNALEPLSPSSGQDFLLYLRIQYQDHSVAHVLSCHLSHTIWEELLLLILLNGYKVDRCKTEPIQHSQLQKLNLGKSEKKVLRGQKFLCSTDKIEYTKSSPVSQAGDEYWYHSSIEPYSGLTFEIWHWETPFHWQADIKTQNIGGVLDHGAFGIFHVPGTFHSLCPLVQQH